MSALMDALSYLGETLDKPGRAVRGLLAGRPDEGLAVVPFSDSLGLTNPSHRVSGTDLLHQYGISTGSDLGDAALGFGTELVLDPMTYLGAGIAGRLAAKAGRALETAAKARGPGYATTAEDLLAQVGRLGDNAEAATSRIENIAKMAPLAFSEVPEGSTLLGAGAEGLAARTPAGDVVRLGGVFKDLPGRPVSENVLQATRAVDYPSSQFMNIRAERVPFAEAVSPGGEQALAKNLEGQGLSFADLKAENAGRAGGRDVVIDPGAVDALPGYTGGYQPVVQAGQPSALMARLLDLLGGQRAMRRALDAGLAAPRYETNFYRAGAVAGAGSGRL